MKFFKIHAVRHGGVPVFLVLGKIIKGEGQEFKASLGYQLGPCLPNIKDSLKLTVRAGKKTVG